MPCFHRDSGREWCQSHIQPHDLVRAQAVVRSGDAHRSGKRMPAGPSYWCYLKCVGSNRGPATTDSSPCPRSLSELGRHVGCRGLQPSLPNVHGVDPAIPIAVPGGRADLPHLGLDGPLMDPKRPSRSGRCRAIDSRQKVTVVASALLIPEHSRGPGGHWRLVTRAGAGAPRARVPGKRD
jgi:hypothetical protein